MTQEEFTEILQTEIKERGWDEKDLAAFLEVSVNNARRYLKGILLPPAHEAMVKILRGSK